MKKGVSAKVLVVLSSIDTVCQDFGLSNTFDNRLIMCCVNNVLLQSAVSVHLRAHFCRYHSEGLIGVSITFSLKLSFYEVHQLIFLLVMYLSAGDRLIL